MNFLKRAFLSTKTRISKTVMLFAVMFSVCTVVLAAISIQAATEQASILARQKLGASVSLQIDMDKVMEDMREEMQAQMSSSQEGGGMKFSGSMMQMQPISLDEALSLTSYEYVEAISILTSTTVDSELVAVGEDVEEEEEATEGVEAGSLEAMMGDRNPMMSSSGNFTLNGVNDLSLSTDYQAGYIDLIDGRGLTDDDANTSVVVIEEILAEQNNLVVGDIFTVTTGTQEDGTLVSVDLEIVGIYSTSAPYSEQAARMLSMSPYNVLYTPYTVAGELKGEEYGSSSVDSVVYHLTDPLYVEDFILESEQHSSIDFEMFSLTQTSGDYEEMMGPIENVASFSETMLILMIVFGGLILTLIIMLSIKDRMNEIGILLSLGETKLKVIFQLLSEILIVLVLALGVSSVVGQTVSEVVADQLLANELEVTNESMLGMSGNMGQMGNIMGGKDRFDISTASTEEVVDELEINVTASQFAQLSVIGVLICMLATLMPAAVIMRLQPKTILSQHN